MAVATLAGVGHHRRGLAEADAPEVGFGDEDGEPGVGEVGHHAERRSCLQQLSLLRHLLGRHPAQRADHGRIVDLLCQGRHLRIGRGDLGAGLGDLLRPAAVARPRQRLAGGPQAARGHVAPRPRVVARLRRAGAAVEQRLHAVELLLGAL